MTTTIQSVATTLRAPGVEFEFDEAQLAAVSFLPATAAGRSRAYRHDLRGYFQWATGNRTVVLGANRAHIELFRAWMEDRGLAGIDEPPRATRRSESVVPRSRWLSPAVLQADMSDHGLITETDSAICSPACLGVGSGTSAHNNRCVRTSPARAWATIRFLNCLSLEQGGPR